MYKKHIILIIISLLIILVNTKGSEISKNEYKQENMNYENINLEENYKNIIKEKVILPYDIKYFYLISKNNYLLNNNTLIVSMTSYPPRINGVFDVLISLLYQSADISTYQCFLTLAKEEFPNGIKDLPINLQKLIQNNWVKLIWYHNIYSHKKLIPVLKLYPDNDILIVDDDILRPYNYIKIFQDDHKKYPKDIICGIFNYYFDNNMKIIRFDGYKPKYSGKLNPVPNIIFQTARPANGSGGVLYPKNTFTDNRFFNETLFMNISPTSDESWQYAFNIIEDRTLRQLSYIMDYSINFIENSQKVTTSLHKINRYLYPKINELIMNILPEYRINSVERQKKIIVSLTSYKWRFGKLHDILNSIFNNTMKPSKIVLTIYKEDYNYLPKRIKELVNNKEIELIVSDIDLRSHLKYFEVMKKYRDYAIITIDDDIIYSEDLIESLYKSYVKIPYCVHARRVHKIIKEGDKIIPYNKWIFQYKKELRPSFELLPTNVGGVLYPPNILNISDDNVSEINKCITADDIYLKYIENKNNIKIVWVQNNRLLGLKQLNDEITQRYALYKRNIKNENLNDVCIHMLTNIKNNTKR